MSRPGGLGGARSLRHAGSTAYGPPRRGAAPGTACVHNPSSPPPRICGLWHQLKTCNVRAFVGCGEDLLEDFPERSVLALPPSSLCASSFLLCFRAKKRGTLHWQGHRPCLVDCCGLRATRLRAARLCHSVGAVRLVVLACTRFGGMGEPLLSFPPRLRLPSAVRSRPRGGRNKRTSRDCVHVMYDGLRRRLLFELSTKVCVVRCRSHPRLKERSASVLEAVEKPHEFGRITHHGIATWLRRHEGQGAGRAQAARALAAHAS